MKWGKEISLDLEAQNIENSKEEIAGTQGTSVEGKMKRCEEF